MNVKATLEAAIGTGELLTVSYAGGSQPGASRMISPIKVEGAKVRARCYTTNKVKVFDIRKITIIDINQSGATTYEGTYHERATVVEPSTLEEAIAPHLAELERLGWSIDLAENRLGLFRFFKNGKRRKAPDVYLDFQESTPEYSGDFPANKEPIPSNPNSRSWHVGAGTAEGDRRAYSILSHAVSRFMDLALNRSKEYKLFDDGPAV